MGSKYNTKYKKGKLLNKKEWNKYRNSKGLSRSQIADFSKTRNVTEDYNLWKSDTRKYDYAGIDTRKDDAFNYRLRSRLKHGSKFGRENKRHRRYYNNIKRKTYKK